MAKTTKNYKSKDGKFKGKQPIKGKYQSGTAKSLTRDKYDKDQK